MTGEQFGRRLSIGVERRDGRVRLELQGELDLTGAHELEEALLAAEAERPEAVVVDLRGVAFLDSTGLRTILSAQLRATVDGPRLILVPGPDRVQRLFALTGTADLLHFEDEDRPPDNVRRLDGEGPAG